MRKLPVGAICYLDIPNGPVYVYKKVRDTQIIPLHTGGETLCKYRSEYMLLPREYSAVLSKLSPLEKSPYGIALSVLMLLNLVVLYLNPTYFGSFVVWLLSAAVWATTPKVYVPDYTLVLPPKLVLYTVLIGGLFGWLVSRRYYRERVFVFFSVVSMVATIVSIASYMAFPEKHLMYLVGFTLGFSPALSPMALEDLDEMYDGLTGSLFMAYIITLGLPLFLLFVGLMVLFFCFWCRS